MQALKSAAEKPFEFLERCRVPTRAFACALLLLDATLVALIIAFVPYTKIDWDAYMSQVEGFLGGERDYTKLEGDTGPLVYPAGFLYIYSVLSFLTGGEVFTAQILFGILYIINLGIILFIYTKTEQLSWWALGLLCLSKRVHSIFILRLFNDCFAMTLLHASIAMVLYKKWHVALLIFSAAVSVKMNVLLYAPPLFLLMLKGMNIEGIFSALCGAALVQVLFGLPFLSSNPTAYVSRAFNLGRVFIHFWSVNFKFVSEEVFVSKGFASALLLLHLALLIAFAHYKWSKHEGGLYNVLCTRFSDLHGVDLRALSPIILLRRRPRPKDLTKEHIVTVMFVGNFIGIVCARSLHYQFYSWYFYSLPFLLWKVQFPSFIRLILFAGVELCWNIYPSSFYSSFLLLCIHLSILYGLWIAPSESPYTDIEPTPKQE